MDGGTLVEETAVVIEPVLPDSAFTYSFTASCDMSEVRSYVVSAFTDLAYDNARDNDTLTAEVEVFGYTPIDLGNDTVVRALEYTIDAGAGYDTYLWPDGSTGQTLVIDSTGIYWVTVKQGTRCENTDSILVTLLVPDVAIERLSNPVDACGYSTTEQLEAYILNTGSDTLLLGETVSVAYQFDGDPMVFDELVVNRNVVPGDSILFSSAGTVDPSIPGTYDISVEITYSRDLIPGNNALDQTIEVYGYPEVSLGEDQVLNTKTYLLDPGAGYVTYTWHDGSTDQQFTVEYENQTPDSLYRVTVSDENGCEASDEVKIGFDLWDVAISSILNPVSGCNLTDQEQLRIFVRNFGTHTILDERISLVASVDGDLPTTVQRRVSLPLNPGDSLEFPLGTTFDFSEKGDHSIAAYTIYDKDDDPENDTVDVTISHLGLPLPGLGGSNDSLGTYLPHTLDAGPGFVSYTWNGEAGSQTYEADHYGWYVLELVDPVGCEGVDSVYLFHPTGMTDIMLPGELRLYPVPASHTLYLEYTCRDAEKLFLEIYDARGREIMIKQYDHAREITETIDVTSFSRGMYIFRLRSRDRQLIRHVVIN